MSLVVLFAIFLMLSHLSFYEEPKYFVAQVDELKREVESVLSKSKETFGLDKKRVFDKTCNSGLNFKELEYLGIEVESLRTNREDQFSRF